MPIRVRDVTAAGEVHPSPFVGPINHTVSIRVDVSQFTAAEVDANGYLKPGVPLTIGGTLIGVAPAYAYGAVVEAVKVADGNTNLAAVTDDIDVAVGLWVLLNRDILEDSLGRALTANELAGIAAAGSHVAITPT